MTMQAVLDGVKSLGERFTTGMEASRKAVDALGVQVKEALDGVGGLTKRVDDLSAQVRERPTAEAKKTVNEQFSFSRLIAKMAAGAKLDRADDWLDAPNERAVCMEGSKQKALSLGVGESLGFIIPAAQMTEIIPLNRSQYVLDALGVTRMDGLKANPVTWNRQKSASTFSWIGDPQSSNITASDPKAEQINLSPKEAAGLVVIGNRLLKMDPGAVEGFVRKDLFEGAMRTEQIAFISGTGVGQPMGLGTYGTTAVGTTNTANTINSQALSGTMSALYTLFMAMVRGVAEDNNNVAAGRWLFGVDEWFKLLGATIGTTTTAPAGTIYPPAFAGDPSKGLPATLLGFPVHFTTDMTADVCYFGDFSQALVGKWAGIELAMTSEGGNAFERNQSMVRCVLDMDVALRQPTAFTKGTGLTI